MTFSFCDTLLIKRFFSAIYIILSICNLNLNFVYLQNIILYEYVPALLEEEIEPYAGKNLIKKIFFYQYKIVNFLVFHFVAFKKDLLHLENL